MASTNYFVVIVPCMIVRRCLLTQRIINCAVCLSGHRTILPSGRQICIAILCVPYRSTAFCSFSFQYLLFVIFNSPLKYGLFYFAQIIMSSKNNCITQFIFIHNPHLYYGHFDCPKYRHSVDKLSEVIPAYAQLCIASKLAMWL